MAPFSGAGELMIMVSQRFKSIATHCLKKLASVRQQSSRSWQITCWVLGATFGEAGLRSH